MDSHSQKEYGLDLQLPKSNCQAQYLLFLDVRYSFGPLSLSKLRLDLIIIKNY